MKLFSSCSVVQIYAIAAMLDIIFLYMLLLYFAHHQRDMKICYTITLKYFIYYQVIRKRKTIKFVFNLIKLNKYNTIKKIYKSVVDNCSKYKMIN